jgi:hypothetical protein
MFERLHTLNKATTFAAMLSLLTLGPVQAQETVPPPEPTGDAGFHSISGTTVKRKVVRTQTVGSTITKGGWKRLNLATLSHTVPLNTTDLFNVTFSAECQLNNNSANDYVRIRVVDSAAGPMEPYDGNQVFCSADKPATHTGTWARRLGPGVHTLHVELWVVDNLPLNVFPALTATIDDWTFELVLYN